jgi:hypothetical protein
LSSERQRRYSPSPQRRTYSPDNRRYSPGRRRYSPEYRYSPDRRKYSLERRYSPDHNRIHSSDRNRYSPGESKQDLNPLETLIEKQETKFELDVKRIFHYFHEYIEFELDEIIPALVDDLWGENSSQERTIKKRDEIWEYIFNKHIKDDEYFKNLQFKEAFKTGMEKLFRQKWENTKSRFCKT